MRGRRSAPSISSGTGSPAAAQTGRGDVHVGNHGVRYGRGDAPGPADQERHPDSVFIERAFGHELRSAVVAHEDDDRVVAQAVFVEVAQHLPEIGVHPVYLVVIGRQVFADQLRVGIERREGQRPGVVHLRGVVRRVGIGIAELQEEGLVLVAALHEGPELGVDLPVVLAPAGVGDDHAGVESVGEGLVAVLRIVEFDLLDLSDPAADGSVEVVAAPGDAV